MGSHTVRAARRAQGKRRFPAELKARDSFDPDFQYENRAWKWRFMIPSAYRGLCRRIRETYQRDNWGRRASEKLLSNFLIILNPAVIWEHYSSPIAQVAVAQISKWFNYFHLSRCGSLMGDDMWRWQSPSTLSLLLRELTMRSALSCLQVINWFESKKGSRRLESEGKEGITILENNQSSRLLQ